MQCSYLMDVPFQKWLILIERILVNFVEYKNKFKNYNRMYQYVFEHPGNEVEVIQDKLNCSLNQGSLMFIF